MEPQLSPVSQGGGTHLRAQAPLRSRRAWSWLSLTLMGGEVTSIETLTLEGGREEGAVGEGKEPPQVVAAAYRQAPGPLSSAPFSLITPR